MHFFLALIATLIFTIFLMLRLDNIISWDWWYIFMPYWVIDIIFIFLLLFVCARLIVDDEYRKARNIFIVTTIILSPIIAFQFTLCQRLQNENNLAFGVIFVPVFILSGEIFIFSFIKRD